MSASWSRHVHIVVTMSVLLGVACRRDAPLPPQEPAPKDNRIVEAADAGSIPREMRRAPESLAAQSSIQVGVDDGQLFRRCQQLPVAASLRPTNAALSRNGQRLVISGWGGIEVWDVASATRLKSIHVALEDIHSTTPRAVLSADGEWLARIDQHATLFLSQVSIETPEKRVSNTQASTATFVTSEILAVGRYDGIFQLHSVPDGRVRWKSPMAPKDTCGLVLSNAILGLSASADGARLTVTWGQRDMKPCMTVSVWNLRTHRVLKDTPEGAIDESQLREFSRDELIFGDSLRSSSEESLFPPDAYLRQLGFCYPDSPPFHCTGAVSRSAGIAAWSVTHRDTYETVGFYVADWRKQRVERHMFPTIGKDRVSLAGAIALSESGDRLAAATSEGGVEIWCAVRP